MDEDDPSQDIVPWFYFVIVFSALHLLVGSALMVMRRTKFPVSGHNVALTIMIAVRCVASSQLQLY